VAAFFTRRLLPADRRGALGGEILSLRLPKRLELVCLNNVREGQFHLFATLNKEENFKKQCRQAGCGLWVSVCEGPERLLYYSDALI
jgi:hypothetical protein